MAPSAPAPKSDAYKKRFLDVFPVLRDELVQYFVDQKLATDAVEYFRKARALDPRRSHPLT